MFISGGNDHEIGRNTALDKDAHNLIDKFPVHISFTDEEELKGKEILNKFGVPEDAKFICLNVRDSGYLSRRHKDHEYKTRLKVNSYRNADINNYILAAEELARRGYYVFRMGIKVLEPLKSYNPKIIDYANSGMRSAFMDIYLGAKCFFCVSTRAGFDGIPLIFRRPIVSLCVPLIEIFNSSKKYLSIVKHHKYKKNQKELTISEIFSSNAATSEDTDRFNQIGVELWENSSEEIRDLVIEMDDRLNGNWNETKEDILLQEKFWSIFQVNINKFKLEGFLHVKFKARFGAKYLRDNQNWIR
jgi:putative glycosyltransferase (TIGR04372 family)